jgi:hypothetical protein
LYLSLRTTGERYEKEEVKTPEVSWVTEDWLKIDLIVDLKQRFETGDRYYNR